MSLPILTIIYGPGALTLYTTLLVALTTWWSLPLTTPPISASQPYPPTSWLLVPIALYKFVSIAYLLVWTIHTESLQPSAASPPNSAQTDATTAAAALFVLELFLLLAPLLFSVSVRREKGRCAVGQLRALTIFLLVIPGLVFEYFSMRNVARSQFTSIRPAWMVALWHVAGMAHLKNGSLGRVGGMVMCLLWLPIAGVAVWMFLYSGVEVRREAKGLFTVSSREWGALEQVACLGVGVAVLARVGYVTWCIRDTVMWKLKELVRKREYEIRFVDDGQGGVRLARVLA